MKRFEIIEQFDECNKVVLSTNSFEKAVRRIMQQLNGEVRTADNISLLYKAIPTSDTICVGDIDL